MKLAEEIRAMQQPIDKEWLRNAILEWFKSRTEAQSVVLHTSNALKEPKVKRITPASGKTFVDEIEIPNTWTSRVMYWAISERFYPELCRGILELKLSNI